MERYAEVAVDIAAEETDRLFHYAVPAPLAGRLQTGHRVVVPFGRRRLTGYVVGFTAQPGVPGPIKEIAALAEPEPLLLPEQVELARWLAERYVCRFVQALRAMLPPGLRAERVRPLMRRVLRLRDGDLRGDPASLTPKQRMVVEFLAANPGGLTRAELARACGCGTGVVDALVAKGVLEEAAVEVRRDPLAGRRFPAAPPPELSAEQARAVAAVSAAAPGEVFLLHGVTGSGKTEVYLRCIGTALERGRQALVLVPEIALTPQIIHVFLSRFGSRVAVLHSALSDGERYDEWRRIRAGSVDVVVGARSAVFAPLPRLGLVVLDEEHETSYKQDEAPRYHAREVAVARARATGAAVVLGSATPAVESYHATASGSYRLLELRERVQGRPLPDVALVDMREELAAGRRGIISRRLEEAVRERLGRREQVILFLNRRGFHTFVLCRECGYAVRCPRCDVSLTLHLGDASGPAQSRLACHYCGHGEPVPSTCPACRGSRIRYFGTGTQRVEDAARQLFPGARVLRMDVDTTATKGAHERIYYQFLRGEADILVGTQMVAKGWDVGGVTLVGVISADTALHLPDFRAAERTFQLLAQVAGRAGRGPGGGEVIVQTYSPEHYSIQAAARHDYGAFYRQELAAREALGYPPFGHLVRLVAAHPAREVAERAARRLAAAAVAAGARPDGGDVQLLGPAPAPVGRLHGRYRWHLALKGRRREAVAALARSLAGAARSEEARVIVDMDPFSML